MRTTSLCRRARLAGRRRGARGEGPNRGLSLLELLIALAISAIVLVVGVPSLGRIIAHNRLVVGSNQLLMAAMAARQTAISRNVPVTVCAGRIEVGCHRDWSQQEWLVFVDSDRDGVLDPGEHLKLAERMTGGSGISISANGPFRNAVVFQPSGTAQTVTGAFAAGRLRICIEEPIATNARDLVLIGSGRIEPEKHDFDGECPSP